MTILSRSPISAVFLCLALIAVAPAVFAQGTATEQQVGLGASAGLNMHSLDLNIYRASALCGKFESGSGWRPNFQLLYRRPLSSDRQWWISPQLHFNNLGAMLMTPALDQARARDPFDSSLVQTNREHQLDAMLSEVGVDLFAGYQPVEKLLIFGGPSIGFLIKKDWEQQEVITTPERVIFDETGTNARTLASGEIPNAGSIHAGFTLGAGYSIPLTTKLALEPWASYSLPFTSIVGDYNWRVSSLRLGANLLLDITPGPPEPVIADVPIQGSAQIRGVLASGGEVSKPTIRIEEFLSREAYPLLSYVFFDESSDQIPPRYYLFEDPTAKETFSEKLLVGRKSLDVYYHTLNIIAHRLEQYPDAKLTLAGSNMNKRIEEGAVKLSLARAERVKKYFTGMWGIDPNRITTEALNLPRNASPVDTREGEEENRRVEITASDPRVLDPLVLDQVERTMDPPTIRVRAETSTEGARVSSVRLTQAGKVLHEIKSPQATNDWSPSTSEMPGTEEPLISEVTIERGGQSRVVTDTSRVEQYTIQRKREERVKDKVITRYNLITFDFDKATLDERSNRILQDIGREVTNQDTIAISGYTDLTGDAAHNKKLSQDRARSVEAALIARAGGKSIATTAVGLGERDLVDNNLPEGRFLSRTVQIRVERPLAP